MRKLGTRGVAPRQSDTPCRHERHVSTGCRYLSPRRERVVAVGVGLPELAVTALDTMLRAYSRRRTRARDRPGPDQLLHVKLNTDTLADVRGDLGEFGLSNSPTHPSPLTLQHGLDFLD